MPRPLKKYQPDSNRSSTTGQPAGENLNQAPSPHPKSPWDIPIYVLMGLSFLLLFLRKTGWGEDLLALSILLFFTKNSLVRWLAKPLRWLFSLTPFKLFILLLLCWTGFSLVLLTFPSHRWMIPQATALPFQYSLEAMFACWAGIVVIMKLFPSSSTVPRIFFLDSRVLAPSHPGRGCLFDLLQRGQAHSGRPRRTRGFFGLCPAGVRPERLPFLFQRRRRQQLAAFLPMANRICFGT